MVSLPYASVLNPDSFSKRCASCFGTVKEKIKSDFLPLHYCSQKCYVRRITIDFVSRHDFTKLVTFLDSEGVSNEDQGELLLLLNVLTRRFSELVPSSVPVSCSPYVMPAEQSGLKRDVKDDLNYDIYTLLQTNELEIIGEERFFELRELFELFMKFFSEHPSKIVNCVDKRHVWQTLLRLEFNSFKLQGDHASGIFPTISFCNHSCNPNCKVTESEGNLVLETLSEIPEGTEININYGFELEKHSNPLVRQLGCKEEMHKNFLFRCGCE
eukprot:TRINITY_DN838_c0_g1_i2.p1 TRINITY_DN838_c0_g1~~TRINITY_DN838_c0_g1_i2.p1  ORF type:complete len:270 (-),score=37.10 TRINITY_DN838_c0_g1_i2:40-849(-)